MNLSDKQKKVALAFAVFLIFTVIVGSIGGYYYFYVYKKPQPANSNKPAASSQTAAQLEYLKKYDSLSGKISSVTGTNIGITKTEDSTVKQFVINAKTSVRQYSKTEADGKILSLSDLKVGQSVSLTYLVSNKTISIIWVNS